MVAEKVFPYRGKALKKGEVFDVVDKSHQRQLRGSGLASDYKASKKEKLTLPAAQTVTATNVSVQASATPTTPDSAKETSAEYNTRVLKPEA